ncbi:MAG: hypothetical protein EBR27_11470 [Betaproteobacteria bacterium]|nr:hypothetical protein [Betaproteobacteria bacterium]
MNKNLIGRLAVVAASAAVVSAHAAIDTAPATAGIADAQTAVLAVLGSMITMAAAIFGVRKVLGLINKRG